MASDDSKKDKRLYKKDAEQVAVEEAVEDAVDEITDGDELEAEIDADGNTRMLPKKRRLCRYPGCTKVIKSQGHCQRHGARAKRCKVEGCDKQAQVRFD
jgi:hypothetical protein